MGDRWWAVVVSPGNPADAPALSDDVSAATRQKGQECVLCSLPEGQEENTDRQTPAFHPETLARLSWL